MGRVRALTVIAIALAVCIICVPMAHAAVRPVPPPQSDDQGKNHWVAPIVIIGAVVAIWYLLYPPATPNPLTPPGLIPGR